MHSKTGQVKAGVTRCGLCSAAASSIAPDGKSYCDAHSHLGKSAEVAEPALKSCADTLMSKFTK